MSVMGEPGGVPVKSSIPVADLGSGLFCAIGILAALIARGNDADGQYVETSLFEAALAMSVWESTEYWSTGESPQPLGSANRMSAPYQALATKDGYLTIGANNEKLWRKLCDVLGVPELETDPRFADNNLRMANRAELIPELERHFVLRSTDEWVVALLAEGVPAGPIRSYADVLTTDPHVKAREMIASFEHPVEGTTLVLASPLRLSGTPVTVRTPPPLLGEHNDEVFAEMSSSQAETRAEET
jgi:crotonobetainyl-CoA:carnitine CoA-transferase CaiB-like acyl-CoA transferase